MVIRKILLLTDDQAALQPLQGYQVTSKLIRDCILALSILVALNIVDPSGSQDIEGIEGIKMQPTEHKR